ncbi:MAG: DUF1844 domain-containing protein [Planctomycetota bacterium]
MVIRKKRVDDDWKQQAEREKEKIAAEEEAARRRREGIAEDDAADAGGGPPPGALPLIPIFEQLGAQAMAGLGQVPDPRTGMRNVDLEMARYAIDLLSSIEAKTKGRLDEQEDMVMNELLTALRGAYTQIEQASAAAAAPPPEDDAGS